MSAEVVCYLDSSAIVKLVVIEPESAALVEFIEEGQQLVSSALAITEVMRAVLSLGGSFQRRAEEVLAGIGLVRVGNEVLEDAGRIEPATLLSLDAIHLATARMFGDDLGAFVTYDVRTRGAAAAHGWPVHAPG